MHNALSGRKKRPTLFGKFKEWLISIVLAILTATFIRWMFIGTHIVVSSSMEPTLLVGDCILVSKMHYGARTPITPLQLPITHQKIPGTNIRSYLDWIQIPQGRLPGFKKIKQNDVIVFNDITTSDLPIDLRDFWIKRCIALPGDTIEIKNKQVRVNHVPIDKSHPIQHAYFMDTKRNFSKAFFEKQGIRDFICVTSPNQETQRGYVIYTTEETAQKIAKYFSSSINSIEPMGEPKHVFDHRIYPWNKTIDWNKDNFGPFIIPKKGMTIKMDEKNTLLYGHIIKTLEGNNQINFEHNECWLNEQPIKTYTFSKNYYFVLGDNRDNSTDSRFIGLIPEDYIVGKAIMVLSSFDKTKNCLNLLEYIRWSRLFHKIT